jgi:hypothetical protein
MARPLFVHEEGPIRIELAGVDIRQGRGVDHDIRMEF